jgi:tRNA pseudouridine13 synthase
MKAKPRKKEGQESLSSGPVPETNVVRCLLQNEQPWLIWLTGHRRSAGDRGHQPFLHFTLQKTNRETSDALSTFVTAAQGGRQALDCRRHQGQAWGYCSTCLPEARATDSEDVWDRVNSVSRKSMLEAVSERGERGVRVGDIDYRKGHLQLGMLAGNAFVITLRCVRPLIHRRRLT